MFILFFIYFSIISYSERLPVDLVENFEYFQKATENISIDSLISLSRDEQKILVFGKDISNPFCSFILAASDQEYRTADSLAGNNLFIHFYFYLITNDESVKSEEISWMKDIISAKGLKGSIYIYNYFKNKAISEQDENRKEILLKLASVFYPDDMSVKALIVQHYYSRKDFSNFFSSFFELLLLLNKNIVNRSIALSYFLFFIIITFLVVFCLQSLYIYIKSIGKFYHILSHKVKVYLSYDVPSQISAFIIVLSPVILFISPIYIGAFLLGLSFNLISRAERNKYLILSAFFLVIIYSLSVLEGKFNNFYRNSDDVRIWEKINYSEGGGMIPSDSSSAEEIFTEALLLRRDGKFEAALEVYNKYQDIIPQYIKNNNSGVLFLDLGKKDSAHHYFMSALNNRNDVAEIHYNLYLIYLKILGQEVNAEMERREVIKLDELLFQRRSSGRLSFLPNDEYSAFDIQMEFGSIFNVLSSTGRNLNPALNRLLPRSPVHFFILILFLFLSGFIFNFFLLKGEVIEMCSICRNYTCRRCRRKKKGAVICSKCFNKISKVGDIVDENALEREIIYNEGDRRTKINNFLSIFFPGIKYYIKNNKIRTRYLILSSIIVALYLIFALKPDGTGNIFSLIPFIIFSCLYLLLGFLSVIFLRDDEEVEK